MERLTTLLLLLLPGLATAAPQLSETPAVAVFEAKKNITYPSVRIPALLMTTKGTLIAVAEARDKATDQAGNDLLERLAADERLGRAIAAVTGIALIVGGGVTMVLADDHRVLGATVAFAGAVVMAGVFVLLAGAEGEGCAKGDCEGEQFHGGVFLVTGFRRLGVGGSAGWSRLSRAVIRDRKSVV